MKNLQQVQKYSILAAFSAVAVAFMLNFQIGLFILSSAAAFVLAYCYSLNNRKPVAARVEANKAVHTYSAHSAHKRI